MKPYLLLFKAALVLLLGVLSPYHGVTDSRGLAYLMHA